MNMTLGSLFAGIGGFDLGFERAGFRTVWQCEIDKAAQGVLRRWFPDAALHSDVCQVGAHNLEPVDVVTFGSPCQDLSVAGKRAGLAGRRSGLFHEAARVIRELRERYGKPDFAIWENVPGAFSSNEGRDFAAVVQAMVDLGARDVCWRVLDSRYFGVAQRRRRVFLVADFGGERAEQILFERESLRGDSAKGGAKRKGAARGAGAGVAGGGREWPANISATLNASFGEKMGLEDQHALNGASLFVPTQPIAFAQNTRDEVRLMGGDGQIVGALAAQPGMKQTTYVAQAVEPFTLAIRGRGDGRNLEYRNDGTANALLLPNGGRDGIGPGAVAQPIAFHPTQDPISSEDGISHAMSNGSKGGTATVAVAVPMINMQGSKGSAVAQADGPSYTLNAMHGHDVHAVAVPSQVICARESGPGYWMEDDVSGTLRAEGENRPSRPSNVAVCATGEVTHALTCTAGKGATEDGTGRGVPLAAHLSAMQVRRLTPVECERLQGFPDGHTSEAILPNDTIKPQADGPRYKQLGNAVTVNVAEWIGRRVAATLKP